MICMPNGKRLALKPQGTLIAGNPQRLETPSGARRSIWNFREPLRDEELSGSFARKGWAAVGCAGEINTV